MKSCMTCNIKPTKEGIFKAHLEGFAKKNLPKDNKCYNNNGNKIEIKKLKPNTTIFYFATNERDFTKKNISRTKAYNNLENSGVVNVNEEGNTSVYLKCPQLYSNTDGNVYSRHMHFLYWDNDKKIWNENLYTLQILCEVDEEFVKKNMNKTIIVDTRPSNEYKKSHVKGAINLPYNKRWSEESILDEFKNGIKKYDGNKLVPIILYCSEGCNMAKKLYIKLNKLGFYNTVHAKDSLLSLHSKL